MSKTEYVVGFLHDDERVVLILKNRPEWQANRYNGVGGHIEDYDDSPVAAMVREFEEETGVFVAAPNWSHFLTLEGNTAKIYCFAANDNGGFIRQVSSLTDEAVEVKLFRELDAGLWTTVPNLKWILPLMRLRGEYQPVKVDFYQSQD